MKNYLIQIKKNIANGDFKTAINLMVELCEKNDSCSRYLNEIIGHQANLNRITMNERQGLINIDTLERQKNHLVNSLLELTDLLEEKLNENDTGKKTILVLVANPENTSSLGLLPEIRNLEEAIQRSIKNNNFEVIWKVAVQEKDLRRHLLDIEPNILHFCGHGTKKGLFFHDEAQKPHLLSNEFIVDLLKNFKDHLECVVLNACETETLAELLAEHIKYAIGMKLEVKDKAAIAFSEAFYDAIGAGEGIETAFEIGKNAILGITSSGNQSRKLIAVSEDDSAVIIQNKEHLIPVLKINSVLTVITSSKLTGSKQDVSIPPILINSVEFIFGEGSKIIYEIQERRELNQGIETDKKQNISSNIGQSISSKDTALKSYFREDFWSDLEPRVKQLLSLTNIHKTNYYLFKKQLALFGGEAFAPPITVNSLTQAEDEIIKNTKELIEILSKVYDKQIII